jgi:hypothetical protein
MYRADVSKASRFILSSSDPHWGALVPIVVVIVLVVDFFAASEPRTSTSNEDDRTILGKHLFGRSITPYQSLLNAQIQDQNTMNFLHALDVLM